MFHPHQTFTGTRYTTTVALLLVAFVASPAAVILSAPVGYVEASLALAVTALCATLAIASWKKHSEMTIPSIVIGRRRVQ
jgi:hypothetical protein